MTVVGGFIITIASGFGFAATGGVLEYAMARIAPDYYRTVFRIPLDIELAPARASLGLGLTQGLVAGLFVGLVIVLTVA